VNTRRFLLRSGDYDLEFHSQVDLLKKLIATVGLL
ncbi:MAG: hypothetical protein QOI53_2101, partial [Verrucomicrobiota bacterium]|nr:hypothetical protein [Verrucomicrobiota bacterium]